MTERADATMAQAVADLQRKQARRARWSRIGGIFVAIVLVVRVGVASFAPAEAKPCDAGAIRSTLADLVNQAVVKGGGGAIKVASISGFATVSTSEARMRCTAHLTMTDQTQGTITYHVDPKTVTIDKLD
jgi:hypothetical protein